MNENLKMFLILFVFVMMLAYLPIVAMLIWSIFWIFSGIAGILFRYPHSKVQSKNGSPTRTREDFDIRDLFVYLVLEIPIGVVSLIIWYDVFRCQLMGALAYINLQLGYPLK